MTSAESRAAELVKLVREMTKFGSLRLTDFQAGQYTIQAMEAYAAEKVSAALEEVLAIVEKERDYWTAEMNPGPACAAQLIHGKVCDFRKQASGGR